MLGEYSVMDLVNIATLLAAGASFLSIFLKMYQDSRNMERGFQGMSREIEGISKEISGLSKEIASLSRALSKEHDSLSEEHEFIMLGTTYISDEMKLEKMARQTLYQNTSRAKEILETMDFMREVVLQNAALNQEVAELRVKAAELSKERERNQAQLLGSLKNIEDKLSMVDHFGEAEEAKVILKRVAMELTEIEK